MSTAKNVFLAGFIGVSVLVAGAAQASIEKIYVSRESRMNPETGKSKPAILNPSGDVELTFTPAGLQLKYATSNGKTEAIQIYADSPEISTVNADGTPNELNQFIKNSYDQNGKLFPGQMLRAFAAHESAVPADAPAGYKPGRLLLLFDSRGRVGFAPAYNVNDVTVVGRGSSGNLAGEIFQRIAAQGQQAIAATRAVRAAQIAAAVAAQPPAAERFPMGFITAKDAVVQRTCESLFRTVP